MKNRCGWVSDDALYIDYHDKEWGVPVHDDQTLFEFLILESMQAGLSWITVLRKRENFRVAFDNFNAEKIARYSEKKIAALMENSGIIRNKQKILATINNAQRYLETQAEFGSFANYLWQFTDHKTLHNAWESLKQVPATTKESDAMAKALKKRGFAFVGSTTCYANMQAIGMVNDHIITCFRHREVKAKK